jgi:hypothetical protein
MPGRPQIRLIPIRNVGPRYMQTTAARPGTGTQWASCVFKKAPPIEPTPPNYVAQSPGTTFAQLVIGPTYTNFNRPCD